ncbi:MAG: hypothetical protein NTU94_03295, partial [Planctomycetota bacterium]|nr:hypothetical protein [Planctomycetota bacterium]
MASEEVSEFVGRVCRTCGATFTTRLFTFPLTNAPPQVSCVCEKCETDQTKVIKARLSARAEAEAAEVEARAIEHAGKLWPALCPPLYRGTDPARLPQDALAHVLAWQWGP